ncbi:hypothetical protein PMI02_01942 [Novosphingobium sp. AP12]|nr:hypothetical protein PMI02_01942 [Novosphingobium sp. AP12]
MAAARLYGQSGPEGRRAQDFVSLCCTAPQPRVPLRARAGYAVFYTVLPLDRSWVVVEAEPGPDTVRHFARPDRFVWDDLFLEERPRIALEFGGDPARKVVQSVLEKSCRNCKAVTQPPAPFPVVQSGWAGPSFLAMLLFETWASTNPSTARRSASPGRACRII